MTITHRPSGSMCLACALADQNCTVLDFTKMQKIKRDRDGITVVRCSSFTRQGKAHESTQGNDAQRQA